MNIEPVKKKINGGPAYMIGSILEGIYTWFSVEKEPPMTRFLAEQLAKSHWFSIDRAKHDFGYEPRISTTEGMDRLIQWLSRENNTNKLQ